jgi:hypothetical protein
VQDLWANSKLQILDIDIIDFPDRSQLQNKDANLLLATLLHNTSLTSLTTSWVSPFSDRTFRKAVAAIGAGGFTSLKHLCLVGPICGPYNTKMVSILRALLPNLENISLPYWSGRAHWRALGVLAHVEDPCRGYGAIGCCDITRD